jgi:hypothetical protein
LGRLRDDPLRIPTIAAVDSDRNHPDIWIIQACNDTGPQADNPGADLGTGNPAADHILITHSAAAGTFVSCEWLS